MLLPLLILLSVSSYSSTRIFEGVARDEGVVAYYQRFSVVEEKDNYKRGFIELWEPSGRRLGYKKIVFKNNPYLPDVYLKEFRTKEELEVEWGIGKVKVRDYNRVKRTEKSYEFSTSRTKIFDMGVHNFIIDHWDEILEGKEFEVSMFLPQFGDWKNIILRKAWSTDGKVGIEFARGNIHEMFFHSKNQITYTEKDKSLVHYRGLSLVKDGKGRYLEVNLDYEE